MARIRVAFTLAALAASSAVLLGQGQATFRGGTDLVTVDVAVRRGNIPVTGLTSADFIVTDNGVRQTIEAVSLESMPVNVSLMLDTSGSVEGFLDQMKTQVREAAGLLGDADQFRLLTFATETRLLLPMQSSRTALGLDGIVAHGDGTALFDALAAGLIRARTPDRGEIAVVFTDGIDSSSTMDAKRLKGIARQSEVVLHACLVRSAELARTCAPHADDGALLSWQCDPGGLSAIATATGGRMYALAPGHHIPDGMRQALADFHSSYALRYSLTGVPRAGWHDIKVKMARPGRFTIRSRRGYQGRD